jgi:hypothetical protein
MASSLLIITPISSMGSNISLSWRWMQGSSDLLQAVRRSSLSALDCWKLCPRKLSAVILARFGSSTDKNAQLNALQSVSCLVECQHPKRVLNVWVRPYAQDANDEEGPMSLLTVTTMSSSKGKRLEPSEAINKSSRTSTPCMRNCSFL